MNFELVGVLTMQCIQQQSVQFFIWQWYRTHMRRNKGTYEPRLEKPAFCICENKDADQLRGNREADQRLCFRYIDSAIPLVHKYEI